MKIFKKKTKVNVKDLEMTKLVYKDLYETYQELYETACKELHFSKLQTEYLYSVLDELSSFTGELEVSVIENALERHELDKLIHAKILFPRPTKFNEEENK